MRRSLGIVLVASLALSGCGIARSLGDGVSSLVRPLPGIGGPSVRRGVVEVSGIRFRTRVTATSEDRRSFNTSTPGAVQAPQAAAEAGRTQAITYCLRTFGGSQIQWTVGPDVEPEDIVLDEAGTLILAGRCVTR
ncbi:MAG: hypothetical protein AAGF30_10020 [Pseudomonadota bacterium]